MSAIAFAASSVHEFTLDSLKGEPTPLAGFKGKVMLVVNVASQCGYTPQYEGLQALYMKYKDQGLVITGFPANNFGALGKCRTARMDDKRLGNTLRGRKRSVAAPDEVRSGLSPPRSLLKAASRRPMVLDPTGIGY